MTQNEMVAEALNAGRKITPMTALREFGCFRLGARIYELKKAGMHIDKAMVGVQNSHGVVVYVAEYRLGE